MISINKKMCQIWEAGTDRSTWILSFNGTTFSEAISSTYANRGTSLGRIEEGLVVVSGYSSSSELEVELFANSYWFEQPSFPDCVSNFWRYSVATVDNTVFTISKWSKITIEIECTLSCQFPTVSYAAYYAWVSNWPISTLEKRLRETKRSLNVVCSVKWSSRRFFIIPLTSVESHELSQFEIKATNVTNFTIFDFKSG